MHQAGPLLQAAVRSPNRISGLRDAFQCKCLLRSSLTPTVSSRRRHNCRFSDSSISRDRWERKRRHQHCAQLGRQSAVAAESGRGGARMHPNSGEMVSKRPGMHCEVLERARASGRNEEGRKGVLHWTGVQRKGLHEQREVETQREMIGERRGTEMQSGGGEKRAEELKGEPMVEAAPARC